MVTHYERLNLPPSATFSDIKKSHRNLALRHHPDKQDQKQSNSTSSSTDEFQSIQTAWETLRDPRKRKEYDDNLEIERSRTDVSSLINNGWAMRVELSEMERHECEVLVVEDDEEKAGAVEFQNVYTYNCRCGDCFEILEEELEEEGTFSKEKNVMIKCNSCTLAIWIDTGDRNQLS